MIRATPETIRESLMDILSNYVGEPIDSRTLDRIREDILRHLHYPYTISVNMNRDGREITVTVDRINFFLRS